ncbi:heat-shock protein [Longibacter salinarum]|uniref:Heat-shock protein n=1 Tax=Longibacter salinarum TaxID=1850348 RepID=A0A2A8CWE6_9BACT|nr:Hsp20/alpha crystallin family protein [Longibacter salinarum]PEN12930.1 heat-shock protein [Longibacter salinarum]
MDLLTRYRPAQGLRGLQDEVNRMFDDLFVSSRQDTDEAGAAVWAPRVDMMETENDYMIRADLPGMTKNEINVRLEDNRLIINGQRKAEKKTEDASVIRTERTFGSFYRSIRLPRTVDDSKIDASFKNGVLEITVPKVESAKPKQIEIR